MVNHANPVLYTSAPYRTVFMRQVPFGSLLLINRHQRQPAKVVRPIILNPRTVIDHNSFGRSGLPYTSVRKEITTIHPLLSIEQTGPSPRVRPRTSPYEAMKNLHLTRTFQWFKHELNN